MAFSILFLIIFSSELFASESDQNTSVDWPRIVMTNLNYEIKIEGDDLENIEIKSGASILKHEILDNSIITSFKINKTTDYQVYKSGALIDSKTIRPIPLWLSILPPLLAIALALIFREVILSLFLGIYLGALFPALYSDGFIGVFSAVLTIIDTYVINALNDVGHLSVIIFSMIIGATVSLISKNGGMSGVVNRLSVYAKSRRSGQLVTWLLGILIFFDDYANTLIVGNTMRPVTDKLKISREKLSYIVDSTAAPIAAIAFVTTWIGAELGYIEDGLHAIGSLDLSVYHIFLNSLKYSFYPIFTLIFIAMLVWMKRDFGPMLNAERQAIEGSHEGHELVNVTDYEMKDFEAEEHVVKKSYNAVIPVLTIIFVTIGGLLYTGWSELIWADDSLSFMKKLSATIGRADAYVALLWSSISGLLMASFLTLTHKILSIQEVVESIVRGFKTMLTAMIILVMAWSLSAVTEDLHTADFLTITISDSLSPYIIPLVTFILAGLVSFSTGSSWGTMAILYPMMLPLSYTICISQGLPEIETLSIFYNVVSCVLAGSVLGDHCSPISDTTILSSLASSCNHIDHVRTQLPYALTVGLIAIVFGTIPSSFGFPFILSVLLGIAAMYFVIKKFGQPT